MASPVKYSIKINVKERYAELIQVNVSSLTKTTCKCAFLPKSIIFCFLSCKPIIVNLSSCIWEWQRYARQGRRGSNVHLRPETFPKTLFVKEESRYIL